MQNLTPSEKLAMAERIIVKQARMITKLTANAETINIEHDTLRTQIKDQEIKIASLEQKVEALINKVAELRAAVAQK